MDIDKEKRLVREAQKGNMDAFEELVITYEKIIYNVIYRIMNNPEDTYDLSQETFIKAYTRLNQFDGKAKFSTWLYRIATNTCLDELRKRKGKETFSTDQAIGGEQSDIMPQHIDETEDVEGEILIKEQSQIVEFALRELSENYRTILILRDMNDLSYDEIAEVLGITLGTVKSRLSRARQELRKVFMQDREPYRSYFRHNDRRRDRHEL